MRTIATSALPILCLSAATLLSTGCSITTDYRIPKGSTHVRSYTTVAGDIEVGGQARIRNAKTVAGDIDIHEDSRVRSLSTVAGDISLATNVHVDGSIRTVAGDITIAGGCLIAGNITTAAGDITLTDSLVEGNVTLTSGKLDVTRTRIAGTVRIRHTDTQDRDAPEITVGPDSGIAAIVVDDRTPVRLRVHRSAKVGSVKGAAPYYYD